VPSALRLQLVIRMSANVSLIKKDGVFKGHNFPKLDIVLSARGRQQAGLLDATMCALVLLRFGGEGVFMAASAVRNLTGVLTRIE
jgi:hypothetical protein